MSNQPSELDFDDAVEMMKGMFPNLEEELIQQYIMEYRRSCHHLLDSNLNEIIDKLVQVSAERSSTAIPAPQPPKQSQYKETAASNLEYSGQWQGEDQHRQEYAQSQSAFQRSPQETQQNPRILQAKVVSRVLTQPFDPFSFDEDFEPDQDQKGSGPAAADPLEMERVMMCDSFFQLKDEAGARARLAYERLREEKKAVNDYWQTDKLKKLKLLAKQKFKNETAEDEEVYRFIFNN